MLPLTQTVELSVLVPIPPRDSPEFEEEQRAPIVAGFPPFCSGEWYAFVRWADPEYPQIGQFGLGYENVNDWVIPEHGSYLALETIDGEALGVCPLEHDADYPYFPLRSEDFLWQLAPALEAPPGDSQARIQIKLVFEPTNVVCLCRSQSTSRFNDLLESRTVVNNVRFYFPHVQRELWSSTTVLINASSYFKSLFGGGFSESTNWTSEPTSILDPGNREDDRSFEDSDDEADNNLPSSKAKLSLSTQAITASSSTRAKKKTKAPTSTSSSPSNSPTQFREIIVKSASYTTYRAILAWIESGQITYRAALRSSPPPTPPAAPATPSAAPTPAAAPIPTPTIPPPPTLPNLPSPKSIYRLAHILDLPTLVAHSLVGIKSRLTVENIAAELFGDVSMAYPDVQQMELEFAAGNWEKVKDSAGMKETERKLDGGEGTVEQGAVAIKLARRLTK